MEAGFKPAFFVDGYTVPSHRHYPQTNFSAGNMLNS